MKAYYLALFMLIITATTGMVDDLGIFTPSLVVDNPNIRIEDAKNVKINDEGIYEYDEDMSMLGTMKTMFNVFIPAILGAVWIAPVLITKMGVPVVLTAVFQVGIWVVYFVGGLQLVTGRNIKHFE